MSGWYIMWQRGWAWLVAVGFSVLVIGSAMALTRAQQETLLGEAQATYDQGVSLLRVDPLAAREAFNTSAARFQQLIDEGVVNGRLEYNLANAHLQAGRVGRAILHYRRAELLMPSDARIEHNLDHARSLRRNQIDVSGDRALLHALLTWHFTTSTRSRFLIFVVAYALFWMSLAALIVRPAPIWRWITIVAAVLWLPLGVSIAVDHVGFGRATEGVLVSDDVVVRKGNGDGFEPQFEELLFEGVEFRQLDERGEWMQIELPDGTSGWIRRRQAALIRP